MVDAIDDFVEVPSGFAVVELHPDGSTLAYLELDDSGKPVLPILRGSIDAGRVVSPSRVPVAGLVGCPSWCDPDECTATATSGWHCSTPTRVPATDLEPCAAAVSLTRPVGGPTMLAVEVQHDPNISAALDMPTEPDVFIYSPGQARQIHWALSRLLDPA